MYYKSGDGMRSSRLRVSESERKKESERAREREGKDTSDERTERKKVSVQVH